ncbi:MAG: HEAT repeat domain-containing protein [Crocinitomicaceae bacterium]
MEKKETAKDKKVKGLINDLKSEDAAVQLKAVKALKTHGNETAVEPLVALLSSTDDDKISKEIEDLINTTKSTAVPAEIAKCLEKEAYANVRQKLMISIWSSGLDYRPYMEQIANATVAGGMMEAVECITIIENLEGMLEEDEIMEALLIFKTYLVETKKEDGPKNEIIKEIVISLQQMNDSI